MSGHWPDLRDRHLDTPEARAAYELAGVHLDLLLAGKLRWVDRNEDKPHRCPECHAVATWGKWSRGPRTRLVCPRDCGVQWRVGDRVSRSKKRSMRLWLREDLP